MTDRTLNIALVVLGVAMLMCIAILGLLAYREVSIPDAMVAVTTGILGLFGGILVPNRITGA